MHQIFACERLNGTESLGGEPRVQDFDQTVANQPRAQNTH